MDSIADIWQLPLKVGNSTHPRHGACAMDAVSWIMYGELGDHPRCVCPVIAEYVINLNDTFYDSERQKLRTYLLRFIDTVDGDNQGTRSLFLLQHCMKQILPLVIQYFVPESVRYVRRVKHDLIAYLQTWQLKITDADCLIKFMPHESLTGVDETMRLKICALLPAIAPAFQHMPLTTLPSYLLDFLEFQRLPSDLVDAMWAGLDGVLTIGRQAPKNYLDASAIAHAHQTFIKTAASV